MISLSFANIKEITYEASREKICDILVKLYSQYEFLLEKDFMTEIDKQVFRKVYEKMSDVTASMALYNLSDFLYRYYGEKVMILLDEYDTPMQEAYVYGYWKELVAFSRNLFNATFKTKPWLERAIMTGITRVSTPQASLGKESIFSDLNHLEIVTTTSNKYADCFGFTEDEVFSAMDELGYNEKAKVKQWYDGFIFGDKSDIYNPWSILNYLDKGKFTAYWANTSSNSFAGKLIREGSKDVKSDFERLLHGESLIIPIDEQIVYDQLDRSEESVWSLLVASGYLKVVSHEEYEEDIMEPKYELKLTNLEVKLMFQKIIRG